MSDRKSLKEKLSIKNVSAFLGTIIALITSFQFLLMPAIDNYVEGKIKEREKELTEEANLNVSFRTLLSQESGIPVDRIHVAYGDMYIEFRQMVDEFAIIKEVIRKEQEEIQVGLVFYHGRLWWRWSNGEDYRVRKEDTMGYFWTDDEDIDHPIGLK